MWLLHRILRGHSGPCSNGNEGVLHATQLSRTGALTQDAVECDI